MHVCVDDGVPAWPVSVSSLNLVAIIDPGNPSVNTGYRCKQWVHFDRVCCSFSLLVNACQLSWLKDMMYSTLILVGSHHFGYINKFH